MLSTKRPRWMRRSPLLCVGVGVVLVIDESLSAGVSGDTSWWWAQNLEPSMFWCRTAAARGESSEIIVPRVMLRGRNPTQGARINSCVKATGGQTDHLESRSFKLLHSFKLLGCPLPQQKIYLPRTPITTSQKRRTTHLAPST
jgi:hypothetical protein